jgi:nickel-dependent lactate racemase
MYSQAISPPNQLLSNDNILETLHMGLDGKLAYQRVLVLIPDHTRSLPLPFLFRSLVDVLHDAKQLDFMVALGTHPPLSEESINKLVGITMEERDNKFKPVRLLNHAWTAPYALTSLGVMD